MVSISGDRKVAVIAKMTPITRLSPFDKGALQIFAIGFICNEISEKLISFGDQRELQP